MLVVTPFPIQIGAVVRCRAIGVLEMDDESGGDAKLLAVPIEKLYPPYRNIKSYEDLPTEDISRIQHFFEHYKDLEKGKWVKVKGWKGVAGLTRKSSRAPNATTRPDQGLVRAGVAPVRVHMRAWPRRHDADRRRARCFAGPADSRTPGRPPPGCGS